MFSAILAVLLCLTHDFAKSETDALPSSTSNRDLPDICYPDVPDGRVKWILNHRQPDYGWKEHTHRANIALAVNYYQGTRIEMEMMELQLEVEIANALLGNKRIHDNDLALFIHALVATNKNPRNFHGKDLVADLLLRVDSIMKDGATVHPFLVLVLCNSNAVEFEHLRNIKDLTNHRRTESTEQLELKALALMAYACAADLRKDLDKFGDQMKSAQKCLINKQATDGSIGNAYTTALAVQALIASPMNPVWSKDKALSYLEEQAYIRVNMIKAYYIELALNAEAVPFIKNLYTGPPIIPGAPQTDKHFIRYTVRADVRPHIYHTISIEVDRDWTLFDVMKRCVREGPVFEFADYENELGLPMIYSVSGIPNDAEENMFWWICFYKPDANQTYKWDTIKHSPKSVSLHSGDSFTLWYRSTDCRVMNQ